MSADRQTRHLVIFTRRPRYGVGKRRLAADVGDLAAWRFQRATLAALRRELAQDRRWSTWLAVTPDRPTGWVTGARVVGQGPGDLGARLTRLARGMPPGPIIVIGSDTPHVARRDIAAGFRALGRFDTVFGPAQDGGFWLVGLSRRGRRKPPFEHVRWSTPQALADTLRNLGDRPSASLRVLEDVDDAASLHRVRSGGVRRGAAV
jgi:glycosyltransferase A (GT-A) superfamily protein (DUF2064 family)